MRTILNILNFVLGGFFTTLAWLFATLVSIVLIFTLPLTRSCWRLPACRFCLLATRPSTSMNFILKDAMPCSLAAERC